MKEIILIAWRNLWRNKRRTLITVSSIFFALFYAILMRSFQIGTYSLVIENSVSQFSGHLQIQDVEYFDNPFIDYAIPYTNEITDVIDNFDQIKFYFPRIQTGALASSGPASKVSMIMGVDFDIEGQLTGLENNIVRYFLDSNTVNNLSTNMDNDNAEIFLNFKEKRFNSKLDLREELNAAGFDSTQYIQDIYNETKMPDFKFSKFQNEVFVGYKLAQFLELQQGDSIIFIGQGFRGLNAVGKYKIAGLVNYPIDQLNRTMVYMPIHTCQEYLGAYDVAGNDTTFYVNYIAMNTKYPASMREADYNRIIDLKTNLEDQLDNEMLTVIGWRNLNEGILETIRMGNSKGMIFIFILYLVISFGILGTVMMLLAERKREFGVMLALGMKKRVLSAIISLEMVFMTLVASVSVFIVTAPIIIFGSRHPYRLRGDVAEQMSKMNMDAVLKFQGIGFYILDQVFVVLTIVFFILIYAVVKINKMKAITALRG